MAGDWVPFDHEFPDKAEVVAICEKTGSTVAETMYALFRLWRWADRHTEDGRLRNISYAGVTLVCGMCDEFWRTVELVGWLNVDGSDLLIPKFSERFGSSARNRMLSAKRMQQFRYAKSKNGGSKRERNASVTRASLSQNPQPQPVSPNGDNPLPPFASFLKTWNATPGVRQATTENKKRAKAYRTRIKEKDWVDRARAALAKFPLRCFAEEPEGWQPDVDWFLRDGKVDEILEEKFNWSKNANGQSDDEELTYAN